MDAIVRRNLQSNRYAKMNVATCDRACSASVLADWVYDARQRTLDLIADLDDEQLMVGRLPYLQRRIAVQWLKNRSSRIACGTRARRKPTVPNFLVVANGLRSAASAL